MGRGSRRRGAGALIVTAAVVLLSSPAAAQLPLGGTFGDDDGSVHESAIEAIAGAGITKGCGEGRFCPRDGVTRGQMAAFLVRALELPASESGLGFSDTVGSAFQDDAERLAAAGIARGCDPPTNSRFCPGELVTRGQMAAFLVRAFGFEESDVDDPFLDDDGIVFESDIARLAAAGVTRGCNPPRNDRFCPGATVTREEMATFMARALGLDLVDVPVRPITLDVVNRDGWGAQPPSGPFDAHTIERLTIHHAGSLTGPLGPAQFRSWQFYHQGLGWPDIAYHYIVGRDGLLYEARPWSAVGDTATAYDPAGHFLVVLEGNFQVDEPTTSQLETLSRVLAWAADRFGVSTESLTGHRDHAATVCPGDNLYRYIDDGSIAARVDEILDAGGVTLVG